MNIGQHIYILKIIKRQFLLNYINNKTVNYISIKENTFYQSLLFSQLIRLLNTISDQLLLTTFKTIKITMGPVSSMCCQSEKKPKTENAPQPNTTNKTKADPNLIMPVKKEKPLEINILSPPPIQIPTRDKKVEPQNDEQIIKQIQEKFPLPNDKKAIKWQNFEISHRIGCGGFGEVFLGELIQNKVKGIKQKYAIKRIPKSEIFKRKLTSSIKLQKKILQQSKCNFITTLHYAFRDSKYLYLVMEWAQGGDTFSLINEKSNRIEDFKKAGEPAVRFILGCLILGMQYLHSKSIMYRDLKPENILIFQNGYAKLTDFGLAKEVKQDETSKTQAGTNIYYAPQMVLREGYSKQIDLWTIGIFSYEMSNYCPPFAGPQIRDKQRVKKLVKYAENNRVWKNPNISEQLKDFINSLLKFEPKERLGYKSWDQIKSHKFFTCVNFDWKALEQMKIKSPLKSIIDNHMSKYKPYIAQDNKNAVEVNSKAQQDLNGWTCKNSNQI